MGIRRSAIDCTFEFRLWCSDCGHGQNITVDEATFMTNSYVGEHRIPVAPCQCVGDSPFGPGFRVRAPTLSELAETARRIADRNPRPVDPPAAQPIRAQMERMPDKAKLNGLDANMNELPVDDRPDATVRFSLLELT